jgi:hypothetical protein
MGREVRTSIDPMFFSCPAPFIQIVQERISDPIQPITEILSPSGTEQIRAYRDSAYVLNGTPSSAVSIGVPGRWRSFHRHAGQVAQF